MKYILIFILFTVLLSCLSQQTNLSKTIEKCPEVYRNGFSEILIEKYKTINSNDTISYNEIRFECVHSPRYTGKVMYDHYGKWDDEIFPSNRKHPILVWNNIDLLNNKKQFTVMTYGVEEWMHMYSSVMVFDENQKDLLSQSIIREKVANLFSTMIKSNKNKERKFYEVYWKRVDPERWKRFKFQLDK